MKHFLVGVISVLILSNIAVAQSENSPKQLILTVRQNRWGANGQRLDTQGQIKDAAQVGTWLSFSKPTDGGTLDLEIDFPSYNPKTNTYRDPSVNDLMISIRSQDGSGDHKYFWFQTLGNGSVKLNLEYPAPGTSDLSEYLIKTIYFGNKVDLTKVRPETTKDSLVPEIAFQPSTVWMWDAKYNELEAFRVIDMPELTSQFQAILEVMSFMDDHFKTAGLMDLATISKQANNPDILKKLEALVKWTENVNVLQTPILKASMDIDRELDAKMKN